MKLSHAVTTTAVLLAACSKPASTTVAAVDSLTVPAPALADTVITPPPAPRPDTVYVNRAVPVPVPVATRPPRRLPPRREPPNDRRHDTPPVEAVQPPRGQDRTDRTDRGDHGDRADRPSSRGTLASGTEVRTTAIDSVHSRYTQVGDVIRVRVAQDVTDNGRTVIPAGAIITLAVTAIDGASNRGERGTLALEARDVSIGGRSMPIRARVTDYDFDMKTRGVGAGEVEKTGAGVAVGALIGHIIGGGTGTVVGAVAGGAGGAAIAAKTADRDIVVHSGAAITLQLTDDFSGS